MDTWRERLTKQIAAQISRDQALDLVEEVKRECQIIAHNAVLHATEIAQSERDPAKVWQIILERKLNNYSPPSEPIFLAHVTNGHDRMCKIFLEVVNIEAAEHRADLLEKIRAMIFRTAGAVLYAIVILGFLYVAKALDLSVPLSRIVPL